MENFTANSTTFICNLSLANADTISHQTDRVHRLREIIPTMLIKKLRRRHQKARPIEHFRDRKLNHRSNAGNSKCRSLQFAITFDDKFFFTRFVLCSRSVSSRVLWVPTSISSFAPTSWLATRYQPQLPHKSYTKLVPHLGLQCDINRRLTFKNNLDSKFF